MIQATDSDGDSVTATGTLTISVIDDVPVLTVASVTGSVDEGGLTGIASPGDLYGNGNDSGASLVATGTLTGNVHFGADGPAAGGGFSLVSASAAATWLTGLNLTSHGFAVDQASISGTTLTAMDSHGDTVFTLTVTAAGAYTFTLVNPLDDPNGLGENSVSVDLSGLVQATDFDGDSVPLAGDFSVTVVDDVPLQGAIQNAIMPSVNLTDAHGTWSPMFGADGPSATAAIGITMGTAPTGETYTVTDTGTHNPAGEEIFSVKVVSGANSYTFYEYVDYNSSTHTGEMFAYSQLTDAQAGLGNNEFFTLSMAANGTYDFHLVSNALQTFAPFNFTTLPPGNSDYATITNGVFTAHSGSDSIAGSSILIDGFNRPILIRTAATRSSSIMAAAAVSG